MGHVRLVALVALTLALAAPAGAATEELRLVASAHGNRSATVKATTKGLAKQLWLYRIGGTGVARAVGTGVCRAPSGARTSWFAKFTIARNQRHIVWSRIDKSLCTFLIRVSGSGAIRIQLRGV